MAQKPDHPASAGAGPIRAGAAFQRLLLENPTPEAVAAVAKLKGLADALASPEVAPELAALEEAWAAQKEADAARLKALSKTIMSPRQALERIEREEALREIHQFLADADLLPLRLTRGVSPDAAPDDLIPASDAAILFGMTTPEISKWYAKGEVRGRKVSPEEKLGKVKLLVSQSDVARVVLRKRKRKDV